MTMMPSDAVHTRSREVTRALPHRCTMNDVAAATCPARVPIRSARAEVKNALDQPGGPLRNLGPHAA